MEHARELTPTEKGYLLSLVMDGVPPEVALARALEGVRRYLDIAFMEALAEAHQLKDKTVEEVLSYALEVPSTEQLPRVLKILTGEELVAFYLETWGIDPRVESEEDEKTKEEWS